MAPGDNNTVDAAVCLAGSLIKVLFGTLVIVGVVDAVRKTLLDLLSELSFAGKREFIGQKVAQASFWQHPIKGGFPRWHVYQDELMLLVQACGGISPNLSNEKEEVRKLFLAHTPEPSAHGFVMQHPRNSILLSWQM